MRRMKDALRTIHIKLLIGLLLVTLPLILLLIYINFYAIEVVRDQVAQSTINLVDLHMGGIDRDLEEIDKHLLQVGAQDVGLVSLGRAQQVNPDQYTLAKIQLFQSFSAATSSYPAVDCFFFFSSVNQDLVLVPGNHANSEYANRLKDKRGIEALFQDEEAIRSFQPGSWIPLRINDHYYLFHIIKTGNVYIGALVNIKDLMEPLGMIDLGDDGHALLADSNYEPISGNAASGGGQLQYVYKENGYVLSSENDSNMIVGEKSGKGEFSLIVVLPEKEVLKQLPLIQRVVSYISYGSIAIVTFSLLLIRKFILLPINRIVRGMKRLREGNLDTRIERDSTSVEFELMNDTFNSMAAQIQELKISIYEEQINHQKAELKHLQLQINPHFFLNSLNIVYYLAQVRDYRLIQEMSLSLIEYFRFMFRSKSDFVALEDELKHTDNYLKIQHMRFPDHLSYSIDFPETLGGCAVPPLVIQSFAENTIKYAVSLDKAVHIHIGVECMPDRPDRINICIEDTGKGFKQDILNKLQQGEDLSNADGEHLGIWNVKRRLQLLFHGQGMIQFSNRPAGGAKVEIEIPLLPAVPGK